MFVFFIQYCRLKNAVEAHLLTKCPVAGIQMHSNKPACGGRKAGGDPEMPSGALPPSKWHKAEAQSLVVLYRAEADFKC